MQQIFVTPDSIYALLWDLARKPKDGLSLRASLALANQLRKGAAALLLL